MDGLPYSALICCLHFWSSSLILNIRISEFELLTVAYTVNWAKIKDDNLTIKTKQTDVHADYCQQSMF